MGMGISMHTSIPETNRSRQSIVCPAGVSILTTKLQLQFGENTQSTSREAKSEQRNIADRELIFPLLTSTI